MSTLSAFREILTLLKTALMPEKGEKNPLNKLDTQTPGLHCREKRLLAYVRNYDSKAVEQSLQTALKILGNNVR